MEYALFVAIFVCTAFLCAALYLWVLFRKTANTAIRESAYDAVCCAEEVGGDKMACAVSYMRMIYPFMSKKRAAMYCHSILAKLDGPGKTKSRRF